MGHEPSDFFITSLLELKLDQNTMFEWQKFSQESKCVPPYTDLLKFINQASESTTLETRKVHVVQPPHRGRQQNKTVASFASTASDSQPNCTLCESEKHPLYVCPHFKSLPRDKMISIIREK